MPTRFLSTLQVLALCSVSVALPITLYAQEKTAKTELQKPDAATILKTLRPTHPRLMASADEFVQLKARTQNEAWAKDWSARLIKEADKILPQKPSEYEIPDGKRLLETSRRVMRRTYHLAMAHRLTSDAKYATRLWAELDAAAKFKDWNPSHFLDTAEMTHAFAIGYDWMFDTWTSEQKSVLKTAIIQHGLKPAQDAYTSGTWWTKARHNWNQVCNGGIGLGALALADEEPALCSELLQNVVAKLPLAMHEFAPDGAWSEGPGYWDYATLYNVAILAGLDSALGTDFGLSNIEGFEQTGDFPLYTASPTNFGFNYADSGDRAVRAHQLFWFAKRFNRPDWAQYARPETADRAMVGLWYRPQTVNTKLPPLAKQFRGADVMTMRSGWNDPNATFVGFKGGDNKANHSHLDLGTWVLDALGERFIFNFGGDNYNLPEYFGKQRWNYYRTRSEGHNTLLFNPSQAPEQDPKAAAKLSKFSAGATPFAVADLSRAYPNMVRVQRGLQLRGTQLVLQDEWQTRDNAPANVWWFAHTRANVLIENNQTALLTMNDKQLRAHIHAPTNAQWQIMDAKPLPSSPQPPKQNENAGTRKLALNFPASSNERLVITFTPIVPDAPKTDVAIKPLSNW